MSEHALELTNQTAISRRRALGYLGAAFGGIVVDRSLSKSKPDQDDAREIDDKGPEVIKINAELANSIKSRASELSKRVFDRDGYSGVRQSNSLSAELWSSSTRLTISLGFKGGTRKDVSDFGPGDLDTVGITYATLEDNVGIGTGETDHTKGTIPPISIGGSANIAFSVKLFEQIPKVPLESIDSPGRATPNLSTEYFLQLDKMDILSNGDDGTPLKPPTFEDAINAALAQFE